MANCHDDLGQIDKAKEAYELAVKCPTDDNRKELIWENFALFYKRQGNFEKENECLLKIEKLQ